MRAYSLDLRQRILDAALAGEGSYAQIAKRFGVGIATVARILSLFRKTGSLAPKPYGGNRHPAFNPKTLEELRKRIQQHPDATLKELRTFLNLSCSLTAIWRALKRLGITRKKKVLHAAERDTPRIRRKRKRFRAKMAAIDPKHLVFVDESSATTSMCRSHGRSPRGIRVEDSVPNHWETVTFTCAMRLSGVVAPLVFEGATNSTAFASYVKNALVPELHPGDVVIWDNAGPHQSRYLDKEIKKVGAKVVRLPPVSPDLNPIEEWFSKLKAGLRNLKARTVDEIIDCIGRILKTVQPQDILGWFHSRAAYSMPG